MTKYETQKNKIVETFGGAHTRLFGLWILLFLPSQSQKALDVVLWALFCLLFFEFSQSFILPFHHHIRRWHLARILCAAFVWISLEFHRARQQQIHPTIEMRMSYIVYKYKYKVKPHIWNLNLSATRRYRMNWNLKFQLHIQSCQMRQQLFFHKLKKVTKLLDGSVCCPRQLYVSIRVMLRSKGGKQWRSH